MKGSLKIEVSDHIQIKDKLGTAKQWFNGVKKFFTVKVLPPRIK